MISSDQNFKKVYLWINGKTKDHMCVIKLLPTINSVRRLKDYIASELKYKNSTDFVIYNFKGLELDDSDIFYINHEDVLCVSLDGRQFDSVNYINMYEIIKNVKAGGYGKVYIGANVFTGEKVAIKKIDTGNLSSEETYNISREAVYLESFKHKNIIKVKQSYLLNNIFYIIMENAKGGELTSYLKSKGLLSEAESKRIFKQIHDAVKYIHSKNVVHRDLNPNNILFLDENQDNLVIIDFGISGSYTGNVKEKINAGTVKFVPPEIASGKNIESSPKIDVWALGIILYLMVFGVNPFDGNNDDEILKKVHNAEYTFPKNIEISKTCKTIITKLLDKKPKQRIDLFDDLFDVWYEENSSDVVIKKQAEEELFKINKDPQQRNSMNNVGAIKETSGKPVTNSSSGIKNKDSNIKNSVFSKKVSNFRIEPKSENSKNKDSDSNSLLIKKFDMKKVEKKK